MRGMTLTFYLLLAGIAFLNRLHEVEPMPLAPRAEYRNDPDDEIDFKINRQVLLDLINILEHDLMMRKEHIESQKRGFDFGVARGYSGAEMAKHQLGIAAASNPWGPGRKKRSSPYPAQKF